MSALWAYLILIVLANAEGVTTIQTVPNIIWTDFGIIMLLMVLVLIILGIIVKLIFWKDKD